MISRSRFPSLAASPRAMLLGAGLMALTILPQPALAQAAAPSALACAELLEVLSSEGRVALQGVEFDFNRASLRPESLPALIAARDAMLALGGNWQIEGHTDNRGSHGYNQALSEARALAVRDWMVAAGVPGLQLSAQGFSFDRPIADNASDAGRARNRRVELVGNVTPDMLGFGGDAANDPCPATLTPGTLAAAEGAPPPPPITEWTGAGGQEWLPFSLLMATGYGAEGGWGGERLSMPPGTQPQACQALCAAESQCAAFSFEPAGSFFVEDARCALIGYGTELDLRRDNAYLDGGTYFASGLKPDARLLTPESEEIARQILADMAEIARLRQSVRLNAPESHAPEDWMAVSVDGAVPANLYASFVEITELDDYAFDWSKSRSALFVHDMEDGRSGRIWVPEPGDYVLRYAIEHPTAGQHVIVEQAFSVSAGAPVAPTEAGTTASVPGDGASLSFPMVVTPGEAFSVSYTGPLHSGDWIDIITPGNDEDMSGGWGWAWATGDPALLSAPAEPGEYRLRYVAEDPARGRVVLASDTLVVRAEAPVTTAPADIFRRCEATAGTACELVLPEHDLSLSLMPGYGITEPAPYVTAGGVSATRPSFEVVRLGDGATIVMVNARQPSAVYCQDGPAGDNICLTSAIGEADGMAAAMVLGSLTSASMAQAADAMGEDEPAGAPGELQGVWWFSIDMPGTADDQAHFIVVELLQDAGSIELEGSFLTAPDIGPLRGVSGDAVGVVSGDVLNLSMPLEDGTTGLVFSGIEYGGDAYRGQVYLAHMPQMPPTGAILRKVAGPGEDWQGAPWMHGEADGMAAALHMGQQALQGMMGNLGQDDRAVAELLGGMMGALAGGAGGNAAAPGATTSPISEALGGRPVDLGGMPAEALIEFLLPFRSTQP